MYQQINGATVLVLAVNTEVSGRKPRMTIQKRLNRPILKADYCMLCRRLVGKPQVIDRIKAFLAQTILYQLSIDCISHTRDLHKA